MIEIDVFSNWPYTDAMQCQLHIRHGQHRLALSTRYIAQGYSRSLIVDQPACNMFMPSSLIAFVYYFCLFSLSI